LLLIKLVTRFKIYTNVSWYNWYIIVLLSFKLYLAEIVTLLHNLNDLVGNSNIVLCF